MTRMSSISLLGSPPAGPDPIEPSSAGLILFIATTCVILSMAGYVAWRSRQIRQARDGDSGRKS